MKTLKVLLCALMLASGSLKADVALPPPTTVQTNIINTPHQKTVQINGNTFYGTSNVSVNDGRLTLNVPKNYSSSNGTTALKTNPVRVTGQYGEVVQGKVTTQTQLPNNSTLNKLATGFIYGQIAGSIINSPNAKQAARDLAQGNYGSAAANAAAAFDVFDVGSGLYGLWDNYANAKAAMAKPLQDAAQAKAQAAEAKYFGYSESARQQAIQAAKANGGKIYSLKLRGWGIEERHIGVFASKSLDEAMFIYHSDGSYLTQTHGDKSMRAYAPSSVPPAKGNPWVNLTWQQISVDDLAQIDTFAPTEQEILNDFLLNQTEIESVIAQVLTQMLQSQQQNTAAITDLVNMLWANNQLNASNTQSAVVGTLEDNTFVSAPYTPAGSQTAQQTAVTVGKDGNITTRYLPRPDLQAGSSQAPIRSPIGGGRRGTTNGTTSGGKSDKDIDLDISSSDSQKSKEICTPEMQKKLLCLDAGSDDYEDLVIPTEEINVKFDKRDYFNTSGSCPAPVSFSALGHTWQISYEPTCKVATTIRPILELLGMLAAMGIAYGAVREL